MGGGDFIVCFEASDLQLIFTIFKFNKNQLLKMFLDFPVYNYTSKKMNRYRMSNIYTGEYKNLFEEFIKFYSPDIIVPFATKFPKLIPKKTRTCRFCGKSFPEVPFNKKAHVLPQFLGNKFLIHDIECDQCNIKFGVYENSFANYIGLLRTADGIKGQSGIPKFKNDGLVAHSQKNDLGDDSIFLRETLKGNSEIDYENKTVLIKTLKHPFIPLHVMKSLFKISYSVLKEDELNEYGYIEKIINSTELDSRLSDYCKVNIFTFSEIPKNPYAITIFKKRMEYINEPLPTKMVLIYFGRFVYEFVLLNSLDSFMTTKGGKGQIIYIPPYWNSKQKAPSNKIVDFSGVEKKTEEEDLIFSILT